LLWGGEGKSTGWAPQKVLLQLKKIGFTQGVRTLNKIEIVDLFKYDGRIVGAVGFLILAGEF
jgi:hypothetical protein